ncbi:Mitochondrial transcription termination factor family protein, putative isoform 1 [Hibiscus syriacus]|uniref:Mitochondrial transcription termination factor family protein, putative isoform 1 n=1 Tax=Hibiscus syriacus TaxID=106335 RepID=A0A6A2WTQ1_HIBSY|nr:uncharacterized protein LOC120183936 [Hibiscus syriacus]XP_039044457.1 uncharacterized protein LOC120183936 [Hibiscus syriacus]KAE8664201.1 Mitochondrial transcription termination factor family protein, putative isoform 1 [Hibiscus syriacus]
MRRGRGKVMKHAVASSHEDPGSGDEESIPASNGGGRLQMQSNNDVKDDGAEKIEADGEDVSGSVPIKEMKNLPAKENARKRNRPMQAKENGIATKLSTGDSIKPVGYRQNGSRRKNKPRRAAEAVVECK